MEPSRNQQDGYRIQYPNKLSESSYLMQPTSINPIQTTPATAIPRKQYTLAAARQAIVESEMSAARHASTESEMPTNLLTQYSLEKGHNLEHTIGTMSESQPTALQMNIQVTKLKYSDTSFSQKLLSEMKVMQSCQHMCDLELCTDNTQIKVHKLILAAASPILLAKFPEIMDTGDIGVEFSSKFTASMLHQFVQYLYDGNLTLSEKNVTDFLKISKLLKLHSLENFCLDFMGKANVEILNLKDEDTGYFRIFKRTESINESGKSNKKTINETGDNKTMNECDDKKSIDEAVNRKTVELMVERKSPRLQKASVSPKKTHMYGTRSSIAQHAKNEVDDQSPARRSSRRPNSKDVLESTSDTSNVENEKPIEGDFIDNVKVKSGDVMREEINALITSSFKCDEKSLGNMIDNLIDIYDKNVKQAVDEARAEGNFHNADHLLNGAANSNEESEQIDPVSGTRTSSRRKNFLSDEAKVKTEDDQSLTTGSGMQRAVFDKPQRGRPPRTLKKAPASLKQKGRRGRPRKFTVPENVKSPVTETMRQPPKKRAREIREFSENENVFDVKVINEMDLESETNIQNDEESVTINTPETPDQDSFSFDDRPPSPETPMRKTPKSTVKKKRKISQKCDNIQYIVQELEKIASDIPDGDTQFKCKLCGNEFVFPKRSVTHLIKTHDVEESNVVENVIIRKRESSPKVCDICGYATKDPNFYYIHYHKYFRHGIPLPKGWKPFTCNICNKECFTKFQLRDHKLIHQEDTPFICEVCGQGFKSRTCLNSHVFHRHSAERKHICSECQRSFKTKTQMLVHMRTHTGEKPFHCPECAYKSTTRGNMRLHLANRHKFNVETIRNLMYQIKTLSKAFALKAEDSVIPQNVIFESALQSAMVPVSMDATIAQNITQSDPHSCIPIQVTIQDAHSLGDPPYPVAITAILESQQAEARALLQEQTQEEHRIFMSTNSNTHEQGLIQDQLQHDVQVAHALAQESTQEQIAQLQESHLNQSTEARQLEVVARVQEQRQIIQEVIARAQAQERQYTQTQDVVASMQNLPEQRQLTSNQDTVTQCQERKLYSQLTEPIAILQDPRQITLGVTQDLGQLTQTSLSRQSLHVQDTRHLLQGAHQLISNTRSLVQESQPTEQVLVQDSQHTPDPVQDRTTPSSSSPIIVVPSQSIPASLAVTSAAINYHHTAISPTSSAIAQVYVTGAQNTISVHTSNLSTTPIPAHSHSNSSTPSLTSTPTPAHHQYDPTNNLNTHQLSDPALLYQAYYQNTYPHSY